MSLTLNSARPLHQRLVWHLVGLSFLVGAAAFVYWLSSYLPRGRYPVLLLAIPALPFVLVAKVFFDHAQSSRLKPGLMLFEELAVAFGKILLGFALLGAAWYLGFGDTPAHLWMRLAIVVGGGFAAAILAAVTRSALGRSARQPKATSGSRIDPPTIAPESLDMAASNATSSTTPRYLPDDSHRGNYSWLLLGVVAVIGVGVLVYPKVMGAGNYSECIATSAGSSGADRSLVLRACIAKFQEPAPHEIVGQLEATAQYLPGLNLLNGEIYNPSSDWTITEITIALLPDRSAKEPVLFTTVIEAAPLQVHDFAIRTPASLVVSHGYSWEIIAAKGLQIQP